MNEIRYMVGIDIGAMYIKAVSLDESGTLLKDMYIPHKGNPASIFKDLIHDIGAQSALRVGVTGSLAEEFARILNIKLLDITRCQIAAVLEKLNSVNNIMDIGGGSCTLIQLDNDGKFQGFASNSLCAAGTGSFLDEQAKRLGISYDDLDTFGHIDNPPTIATRCSVFAKSDLIHRQQEGYTKQSMWSGLCRGMTRTLLGTLLRGKPLDGPTAVIGGVAQNREVIRWLKGEYPDLILVPDTPHLLAAIGAARLSQPMKPVIEIPSSFEKTTQKDIDHYSWPLTMEKSIYPSFQTEFSYEDHDGNEIRIDTWPDEQDISSYIGIDIGSTSTKLVVMDQQQHIIIDIYRKTAGDPIDATKKLFGALTRLLDKNNVTLHILGVGTTGSGRKIVGTVIGADVIINEISAHVAGATKVDPSIDTIFEIGGQDSKYMHVKDGNIRDSHMNYVCAAGTGSFVEEQANKLGYKVSDVGHAVSGLTPPIATDRCTVFMEQDVAGLIQSGATSQEALAAVMVSVIKNYLNKVVGNRYYNRKKVFFQGATARNQALVAAFERVLDIEMVVSPYCHVMGAYGVAILTQEAMEASETMHSRFVGLDLEHRSISLRNDTCTICENNCMITIAEVEGIEDSPSWGYMCGRDPHKKRLKVNTNARLLKTREKLWLQTGKGVDVLPTAPLIGIPQALTTYTYLPLWRRFFNRLGYRVQLSGPSTEAMKEMGSRICGAEFCFPVKVALGHIASLSMHDGVDFVFVPQMVNENSNPYTSGSTFCPYVQGTPTFARSALTLNNISTSRLLSPVVDMKLNKERLAEVLVQDLGMSLGRSKKDILQAWQEGVEAQNEFTSSCVAAGKAALSQARAQEQKLLVLIGRPYNNFDTSLNLGLPFKMAEQNVLVIPLEFLELDFSSLRDRYTNIYWTYGQKILAALEMVARDENLEAVYLTNFSCGPDSFLLSYAEEVMGNKPFLSLELDEHGADAGYLTRIEAFFDVLGKTKARQTEQHRRPHRPEAKDFKDRTIWLPPMHQYAADLLAAAFHRHGYNAQVLPAEDKESFEIGRTVTRGSECLPTSLTIGTLLKTLRAKNPQGKHAFLMATAQGPCRFGQYCNLHRQILDREGFEDVAILSPSSTNSYQGLDEPLRKDIFKAIVISDIIMKIRCKVRPYEIHAGETDRKITEACHLLSNTIKQGGHLCQILEEIVHSIHAIPTRGKGSKPLVGIVGEIYVRNNLFASEHLVDSIEEFGGEVWLTPLAEWFLYTSSLRNLKQQHHKLTSPKTWKTLATWAWMRHWEQKLYKAAGTLLDDRHEPDINLVMDYGAEFMKVNVGGEAMLTIGRTKEFANQGASMVVNCAPFGCMPGNVTTAVFQQLSKELNMPIVNMFYDGRGDQNQRLHVFLNNTVRDSICNTGN